MSIYIIYYVPSHSNVFSVIIICHHHVKKNSAIVLMKRVCSYCFHVHSLQAPRLWQYSKLKPRLSYLIRYARGHCLHLPVLHCHRDLYIRSSIHVMQTIVFDSLCPHSGSDQNIILYAQGHQTCATPSTKCARNGSIYQSVVFRE